MAESIVERDPLEVLAAEFTARLRAGERPSIEEYATRQPDCAEQIRELFPTIAAMEQWKSQRESKSGGRATLGPVRLKQLGDFRMLREIGRGGMGIVYEAEQLSLNRRVAVKVLPKQALLDEKHLLRFRREARTAAKLHHTNIVPVLGIGEHDGFHFIVMQYIDGVSVDTIISYLAQMHNRASGTKGPQATPPSSSASSLVDSSADSSAAASAPASAAGMERRATDPSAPAERGTGDALEYADTPWEPSGLATSPSRERRRSGRIPRVATDLRVENVTRAILRGEFQPSTLDSGDSLASSSTSSSSLTVAYVLPSARERGESSSGSATAEPVLGSDAATTSAVRPDAARSLDFDFDLGDGDSHEPRADAAASLSSQPIGATYWRSVARMGVQVADAMQYAHLQGTLHRDIKPANLLVDQRGMVWVADFGLAKAVEQDDVSRTGDIVGTLRYMAPEQLMGQADKRSDIFSLGLTLYELLTFRPAYNEGERKRAWVQQHVTPDPPRPRKVISSVPRDLETIVLKAIDLDPQRRYQSAGQMADDLRRFLEDRPIRARQATAVEYVWRWCRRNPAVASLSGLALLLLTAVTLISSIGYARTKALNESVNEALKSEREQSRQALLARQAADEARHKAEVTSELAWNALDQMVTRFAPRRTISPEPFLVETDEGEPLEMETQPVLSKETAVLLEELLSFYDQLAEQGDNSASYQRRIAEANRRVGDIQQRLGRLEAAEAAYRRAIETYHEIHRQTQQTVSSGAQLASAHNELGKILRQMRRSEEAGRAFESARQILQPIVTQGDAPEARYELARAYFLQSQRLLRGRGGGPPGDLWRRGNGPNGNNRSRGSRAPDDRPPTNPPQPVPVPSNAGQLERDQPVPGSTPSPTEVAGSPVDPGASEPARDQPASPPSVTATDSSRGDRPGSGDRAGEMENRPNRGEPALPSRVVSFPPDTPPNLPPGRPDARPEPLGGAFGERFRGGEGNFARDREFLANAVALLEPLTREYPAVPDYQQLLALIYLEQGYNQRREKPAEAVAKVEQAVAILTQLVDRHPGQPDYQFTLSIAYTLRPTPETDSLYKQLAAQIQQGNQALDILRKLNLAHPHILDYLAAQVPIVMNVGLAYDRTEQYAEAEQCFRQALAIQETLGRRYPEVSGYQQVADFMRHPYIDFLLKRYEQTQQSALLDEAAHHLETAASRLASLDQRYARFLRYKIFGNLTRLASLYESAGNHEAQADVLELAARFRGEPVSPRP